MLKSLAHMVMYNYKSLEMLDYLVLMFTFIETNLEKMKHQCMS
jgi:hypothetical protein